MPPKLCPLNRNILLFIFNECSVLMAPDRSAVCSCNILHTDGSLDRRDVSHWCGSPCTQTPTRPAGSNRPQSQTLSSVNQTPVIRNNQRHICCACVRSDNQYSETEVTPRISLYVRHRVSRTITPLHYCWIRELKRENMGLKYPRLIGQTQWSQYCHYNLNLFIFPGLHN